MLSTLFVGTGGTTTGIRLCSGVRVVSMTIYTSVFASMQWLSQYSPTSETSVNGTSTTAPGVLISSPPSNSTASFWSQTNFNESENLFILAATINDYVDVHFQIVLMDDEAVVTNVTSGGTQNAGQVYRSYLDGPRASPTSQWRPIGVTTVN